MTNIKATVISMLWVTLCFGATFAKHYTPQWAVHIDGGTEIADSIAFKHGFINRGEIFSDSDMYHFEHRGVVRRSIQPSHEHHERLTQEPQVRWARQQVAKSRKKRDFMQKTSRSYRLKFPLNDPRWPQMWYLNRDGGLDMNVQGAWLEGVTGKGIVVTILDDGLEKDHPDLLQNYDPQASYDVNNHDLDPMPRYEATDSNRHGTRCAGEVAAVANNTICAVGIAFGANVGGVRMLDGDVTDAVEATSLSYHPQHIDIYSASWGPDDDGKTVDGPGELATRAFVEGVKKGRRGKGSIFIWASGNGGRDYDNCNCDGYTNSIWTLSISSATENGLVPWYSEACSSTLATTYSSGATGERQVVTTDLRHECTTSHTGTSASAPLAAGICALALEANNNLTWRDMQHIVVRTSRSKNLDSSDWKINGVGRNVSHSFGYGLMDATAMVKLAREWKTVPEQRRCEVSAPQLDKSIPANSQLALNLTVRECPGVNYLEHVQAKMTLSADRRGDIQIHLTSPAGTRSTLLAKRPHDVSRAGFKNWPFMTVHNWGESPFGVWQLEIHNKGSYLENITNNNHHKVNITGWKLILHGTETLPDSSDEDSHGIHGILGSPQVPDVSNNISTRYSNSSAKPKSKPSLPSEKAPDIGNSRPWHDEQHQHNGVERTTIEDTSSGTGCVVLARSGHQCIECEELMFLFDGICVSQCPPRTHVGLSPKGRTACLRCHYSCLACSGPNIDQCLACSPDAYLQSSGLCLPLAINSQLQATRWYFWLFVAFSLNLVVLVLIVLVLVCYIILNWVRQGHQKHHYHIVQQEGGAVRMSKVDYISDSSDEEK